MNHHRNGNINEEEFTRRIIMDTEQKFQGWNMEELGGSVQGDTWRKRSMQC